MSDRNDLRAAFDALRDDLIQPDGPRISTMRRLFNYAIVQYKPELEFALREQVQRLVTDLAHAGWMVHTISLYRLFLRRLEALGPREVERMIELERKLAAVDPARGLTHLRTKVTELLEGRIGPPGGIAADVSADIDAFLAANPDQADRTVVLLGRAGALYPFFRLGALLGHLDTRTRATPIVLLFPGTRPEGDDTGNRLSFMGKLDAVHDYRPRIYP